MLIRGWWGLVCPYLLQYAWAVLRYTKNVAAVVEEHNLFRGC